MQTASAAPRVCVTLTSSLQTSIDTRAPRGLAGPFPPHLQKMPGLFLQDGGCEIPSHPVPRGTEGHTVLSRSCGTEHPPPAVCRASQTRVHGVWRLGSPGEEEEGPTNLHPEPTSARERRSAQREPALRRAAQHGHAARIRPCRHHLRGADDAL